MSEPSHLLLDSDIFVLLAGAGLLPELISAVGLDLSKARRLEPLPHMLQKGPLARKFPPAMRERATAWCSQIPAIEEVPSPELIDRLVGLREIDAGEAFLFAIVAETKRGLLATGDKRACLGLHAAEGLGDLELRLAGKVICLETALEMLLETTGYPGLIEKLTSARECNQTLRILLSRGEATPEEDFRTALEAYSKDLSSRTGKLLFHRRR